MTKEGQFLPYEQALVLKELGFDERCFFSYDCWNTERLADAYYNYVNYNVRENSVSAPLYQQAFRWFREKYKIDVNIQKDSIDIYHFNINTNKYGDWKEPILNRNYEEAELECLKKLIELIKNEGF